jgi:protein TonB
MSFVDEGTSSKKMFGLGAAIVLHILLGYAFISGMAVKMIQQVTGPLEVVDIADEIKPEDEPPPPPEKMEEIPPYVPPPEINIDLPPPPPTANVITTQTEIAQPKPAPVVVAPPPPPPPAPKARTGINPAEIQQIFRRKARPEFPPSVVRQMTAEGKEQVTMSCEIYVSAENRVTDARCSGSGYERLDELAKRFFIGTRITAATEDGQPVGGWARAPNFVWRLEDGR